jgi:flagellar biosynthesis/type III secretory pathway M-ring protein FliF/YscJ
MKTFLKKWALALSALLASLILFWLYRKAAALRTELKLLQAMELKRKAELEEAQKLAQAETDQQRVAQLQVELSCLRGDIRARDEKLAAVEQAVKIQTDQVLKAKSFAELEKILEASRKSGGPSQ